VVTHTNESKQFLRRPCVDSVLRSSDQTRMGDEIVPQKLWVCQRLRRIAAKLRATAIKNVNANSVLHMDPPPVLAQA
jgi:hypothetical protein